MTQTRLFADARPLVERLGRDFFRQLPQDPGVYFMRGPAARLLYVGKAKNLRKRVGSYLVSNPERMARRTLKMLRLVECIEWEICCNELAALQREAELLLSLRPQFNRAGTWQGPKRYLSWHCQEGCFEVSVDDAPTVGRQHLGPTGSQVHVLRLVLVRLVWFMTHPEAGIMGMPVGWVDGHLDEHTSMQIGPLQDALVAALQALEQRDAKPLCQLALSRLPAEGHRFVQAAVEADLELLEDLFRPRKAVQLNPLPPASH